MTGRERAEDVDLLELENGAVISRIAPDCEVCEGRGEERTLSTHKIEFDGQTAHVCLAHAQEVLNLNEDELKKGDFFKEVFHIEDPK